jgi:hypothetical protein
MIYPQIRRYRMPTVDAGIPQGCVILPFNSKDIDRNKIQTTSLAALIAVTVLHEDNVSAEDKLMEIIERSGEVEILDADDVYADFGLEELDTETGASPHDPANDNRALNAV